MSTQNSKLHKPLTPYSLRFTIHHSPCTNYCPPLARIVRRMPGEVSPGIRRVNSVTKVDFIKAQNCGLLNIQSV